MSWNNAGLFGTVKFRVALWYAVLFILSSLICFLLTFAYQKRSLDARMDRSLTGIAETLRTEYLAGNRAKRLGREIPLVQVPASHFRAYYEKFPGLRPLIAFENPSLARIHYNVVGAANGNLFLLRVDGTRCIHSRSTRKAIFRRSKRRSTTGFSIPAARIFSFPWLRRMVKSWRNRPTSGNSARFLNGCTVRSVTAL